MNKEKKNIIIFGIYGQDATLLSHFLFKINFNVIGIARKVSYSDNHKIYGIDKILKVEIKQEIDEEFIIEILNKYQPVHIYNLAGLTSVWESFKYPLETINANVDLNCTILKVIKKINQNIRYFYASSGDVFGDCPEYGADEKTLFLPKSPYAISKAVGYWHVKYYREKFELFCVSGILFNHESKLRSEKFVTSKIIDAAKQASYGNKIRLTLNNINIRRDWGWAPEFVEAMYLMLNSQAPKDYVIGTGVSYSLADFGEYTFSKFNLNFYKFLDISGDLLRPVDIFNSLSNPIYIKEDLGWNAKIHMPQVIDKMIE
jgi:GDPmannose 4,6-dehydratase